MTPSKPTAAEQIDRELAASALKKRQTGGKPSARELAALRRIEKAKEESDRWAFYATVPKKHYREMSGRQVKVLNEQASAYGMPIGGATVNLAEVIRWIHDFLAKNKYTLMNTGGDPLLEGASQDLKDEYVRQQIAEKREKAALARLDRQEREREMLPRVEIRAAHGRIAAVLRAVGTRLQKAHGAEAQQLLDEALDDAQREIDSLYVAGDGSSDPDGDGDDDRGHAP